VAIDDLPPGGLPLPEHATWDAWQPFEVAERLSGVDVSWCVAGGWAMDLFRGHQSREHDDIEIAVPKGHFPLIRAALAEFDMEVVGSERRWPLDHPAYAVMHQTWVREPETGIYRLDIFREPHDGETWICRRDQTIRLGYDQIILTAANGVPFLAPEVVLLFKAKHDRATDRMDLAGVLPLLGRRRRVWLAAALERVHPGHPWARLQ
jgi:hypothetical protein